MMNSLESWFWPKIKLESSASGISRLCLATDKQTDSCKENWNVSLWLSLVWSTSSRPCLAKDTQTDKSIAKRISLDWRKNWRAQLLESADCVLQQTNRKDCCKDNWNVSLWRDWVWYDQQALGPVLQKTHRQTRVLQREFVWFGDKNWRGQLLCLATNKNIVAKIITTGLC